MKNIFAFYQTYIEISDLLHLLVSFTSVVMQSFFVNRRMKYSSGDS